MFTKSDLLKEAPRWLSAAAPPLSILSFEQDDFTSPSSEQCIRIHRGRTRDFESGAQFWIAAVKAHGWSGREDYLDRYFDGNLCEPLSLSAFDELVAQKASGLVRPPPLPLHPARGFVGALRMYDDWNYVTALAAYEDELIAFFWDTSA